MLIKDIIVEIVTYQNNGYYHYKMTPKGITIHNTDNTAPAINERNNIQRQLELYEKTVAFHLVVDDKEGYQILPFDITGIHAGDDYDGFGNSKTIAIEIAKSSIIDENLKNKAIDHAAELTADLCKKYNFDPDKDIYFHYDHSQKKCPQDIIIRFGNNDPVIAKKWYIKKVKTYIN